MDACFQQKIPGSSFTFRLVKVPGGQFLMGSPADDPDASSIEIPQHAVELDSFWIAEHTVTQALWELVMGENPAQFKGAQRPVEDVSWFDAVVFCNALSQLTGRDPAYRDLNDEPFGLDNGSWILPNKAKTDILSFNPKANGYRLPTEAEWEFAAKGGHENRYRYAGSDLLEEVGWYSGNTGSGTQTREVGRLRPNALGLYDMSGNVWEWCEDLLMPYTQEDQRNPVRTTAGFVRVLRGGSWDTFERQFCRSTFRFGTSQWYRGYACGFRLVLQSNE